MQLANSHGLYQRIPKNHFPNGSINFGKHFLVVYSTDFMHMFFFQGRSVLVKAWNDRYMYDYPFFVLSYSNVIQNPVFFIENSAW